MLLGSGGRRVANGSVTLFYDRCGRMLLLGRRKGQKVFIGDFTYLTVAGIEYLMTEQGSPVERMAKLCFAGDPNFTVFARKRQKIIVHGDVTIEVISISSDTVRLGFDAPESIRIIRDNARKTERESDDTHQIDDSGH